MGRFWLEDSFIREEASKLSLKAIAVYTALCSSADPNGKTFIGYRTIAKWVGINKSSVVDAIKELKVYGLVVHSRSSRGRVYEITVLSVRNGRPRVYGQTVPKEGVIKEGIKEGFLKEDETRYKRNAIALQKIRTQLTNKGIFK